MKNEKFYIINNNFSIATNMPFNELKKTLFREFNIKIKTIKEITFLDYIKWLNSHHSKTISYYYN